MAHGAGAGFAPLSALLVPTPGIPAGLVGEDMPEPAANLLRWLRLHWRWREPPPRLGGFSPKCRPWREPCRCQVHGGRREQRLQGVCLARVGFALVQLRFSPAPPAPGLSVSDGDQRGLLLAVRTALFPCEPAVPSAPAAPRPKDAASGDGCREPQLGAQERGDVGTRRGWADPFGGRGKGEVWRWRGLSDGFQSRLPLLFPHFIPEIN